MIDNTNFDNKVNELTTQGLVERLAMLEYENVQLRARLGVTGELLKAYQDAEQASKIPANPSD